MKRLLPFALLLSAPLHAGEHAEARAALRAFAKAHAAGTLRAAYAQERTTELTVEPLRARGVLYFRREPPCLVVDARAPRQVRLRLDRTSYQVVEKDKKRAERYVFREGFPGAALLDVFRADVKALEAAYGIAKYERKGGLLHVTLAPRDARAKKHVRRIEIALDAKGHTLAHTTLVDAQGDRVRLELSKIERDVELDAKLFAKEPPDGVKLTVTEVDAK